MGTIMFDEIVKQAKDLALEKTKRGYRWRRFVDCITGMHKAEQDAMNIRHDRDIKVTYNAFRRGDDHNIQIEAARDEIDKAHKNLDAATEQLIKIEASKQVCEVDIGRIARDVGADENIGVNE